MSVGPRLATEGNLKIRNVNINWNLNYASIWFLWYIFIKRKIPPFPPVLQASIHSFQPERTSWKDQRRQIQANSLSLLWWIEWHYYEDVKFKGKVCTIIYFLFLSITLWSVMFPLIEQWDWRNIKCISLGKSTLLRQVKTSCKFGKLHVLAGYLLCFLYVCSHSAILTQLVTKRTRVISSPSLPTSEWQVVREGVGRRTLLLCL